MHYVDHVSFLLDARIFFRTFAVVLGQEGIYVEDGSEPAAASEAASAGESATAAIKEDASCSPAKGQRP